MADANDQPVKTPPAMPSALRRSFAASQARRRPSSRSSRTPSLGEFGNELDFSEFLASDTPNIAPVYGADHSEFNSYLYEQPHLTSDFITSGNTRSQLPIDARIDPQLEGLNGSSWTQSQTRKASQSMVANPFTALPSFGINDFGSYPSSLAPAPIKYLPSHAQYNAQGELNAPFVSQGTYGNFTPQEYLNQPYYNSQAHNPWLPIHDVHSAETYASNLDPTLPLVDHGSEFQYPDPTYAGAVGPYGAIEQHRIQLQNRLDGDLSPVSRGGRTSSQSNNSSYSSQHGRSSSSTDTSERRRVAHTRKVTQRRSLVQQYEPEKPKVLDDKAWIRINGTTMGLSTRTGKINNYKVPYEVRPPPKDWHYFVRDKDGKPTKVEVKYTKNGELVQDKLSAREIKDFIFRYRENEERPGSRLKLWIQKCPTDSARRYFNKEHSKCRFSECPAVVNQTGTILHGHYRVAFDEMWLTHGKNSDPYFASMYAHLYCMERFLDFKVVCKHRNVVEVDSRELLQEPKGRWAASLHAQPESTIARDFVKLCRGEISYMDEFENYPVHSHYKRGAGKPHENTLTYYMHEAKESTRPPAQLDQFIVERNLKRTHILVHKGNLDVMFSEIKKRKERRAKRAKKARRAKRKKRANDNEDDESNTDNEEEDPLITSILEKIASARAHASKNKRKKRMPRVRDSDVAESEEESEEEEFNNPDGNDSDEETIVVSHTPSQGSRSSARIARQVQAHGPKHYAVDAHDVLQEERIETSHTRKRPEEESTEIKDMHKAKRIKLVSSKEASQVEAVRPANKRAHSPTVEKSGESQFLRPNKRQRTFESPGSRLSLDSNGLPRLPDFRAYPSTDTCNEDTPIQRFGKAQPELPSEEAGQGLDFGEFDYLFTDLERRQSSFSDAGRRRSRGLSLLKSTGAPRIARVASVTFAEKHSTREFREDDPPRTSPVEYSQVNQGPRRSGRTNKAIQSSAKPTGIQKKGEKGVSKKRRTKQK